MAEPRKRRGPRDGQPRKKSGPRAGATRARRRNVPATEAPPAEAPWVSTFNLRWLSHLESELRRRLLGPGHTGGNGGAPS